jgi:AcrR family transcriptional regulator
MTVEPGWPGRVVRLPEARSDEGVFVGPRTKLVAAGQQLLFERGDSSFTVEELVRRAGVAIKTFYRCFTTKDDFLEQLFTALVAESGPGFRERVLAAADDPLDRLRVAVTSALQAPLEDHVGSRALAVEHLRIAMVSPKTIAASSVPYRELVRDLLIEAGTAGQIRSADPDWDSHLITSMVTNSFLALVLRLDASDPAELADNVWRFCLSALGGTMGKARS